MSKKKRSYSITFSYLTEGSATIVADNTTTKKQLFKRVKKEVEDEYGDDEFDLAIVEDEETKIVEVGDFSDAFLKTSPRFIVVPTEKSAKKLAKEYIGVLADIFYGSAIPEQLVADPDNVRFGSWNLQHLNDKFNDAALEAIAGLICNYDLIFCVEVSKTAPWSTILLKSSVTFTQKTMPMGTGGFNGTVLFNKTVDVFSNDGASWSTGFNKRPPFTFIAKYKKWHFAVTEVHLTAGEKKETLEEIAELTNVRQNIQSQVNADIDCIFSGDFNADIRTPKVKKAFDTVLDENGKIYKPLLDENTMNSWKIDRCNDNILIPKRIKSFIVGDPIIRTFDETIFKQFSPDGGQYLAWNNYLNVLQPLFTDHSLVSVVFAANNYYQNSKTVFKTEANKIKVKKLKGN